MEFIHTGLITTDDDDEEMADVDSTNTTDVAIATAKKRFRVATTDSDDSEFEEPKKIKCARESDYNKFIKSIRNPALLEVALTSCPDKMIMIACQNVQNINSIDFMEWSECVLIQLCTLKKPIKFGRGLRWTNIKEKLENYQWSIEVVHNIKKFIGVNETLLQLLSRNHQYKINVHKLDSNMTFVTKALINYSVLKSYKLTLDLITKPLLTNRLPTRFRKITNV